jgi:hypothetical protein
MQRKVLMENLTISKEALNKYFGILKNIDVNSKKELIINLTKSINTEPKLEKSLDEIFGAWKGDESSEDIVSDIKSSRFNNRKIEEL